VYTDRKRLIRVIILLINRLHINAINSSHVRTIILLIIQHNSIVSQCLRSLISPLTMSGSFARSCSNGLKPGTRRYAKGDQACTNRNSQGTQDLATFLSIAAPEVEANYTTLFTGGSIIKTDPETLFKNLFNEHGLGHPNCKHFKRLRLPVICRTKSWPTVSENTASPRRCNVHAYRRI
jgi:hypothetical protein